MIKMTQGLVTLGTLFIALKAFNVVTWSWWLVLMPFWIGPAFSAGLVLFIVILAILTPSSH